MRIKIPIQYEYKKNLARNNNNIESVDWASGRILGRLRCELKCVYFVRKYRTTLYFSRFMNIGPATRSFREMVQKNGDDFTNWTILRWGVL